MPTSLTALKEQLTKLIEKAELKAALMLLKKHLHKEASIGNDITLLLSRFNTTNKEIRRGTISHENANRSFANINYALTSCIEELETTDVHFPVITHKKEGNGDKTIITSSLTDLEREGLETQRDLLQKRINRINKALAIETDPSRQFAYEEQVAELTEKLKIVKEQLL